jgi:hypothetical protein
MPSPVEELKDVLATNHTSSRSTSPVQDIQLISPPGLSDTSIDFVARTKIEDTLLVPPLRSEEKQPLSDNHAATSSPVNVESDSNPSSTHLNGSISRTPSIGMILTGIRRPKSFSKPKTPNHHDSKKKADVQERMPPFGSHLDAGKPPPSPPRSPKRPATSAGSFARPGEKEKDGEKGKTYEDTDSRPSWFRRRSFKGSNKARPMSVESLTTPPLPTSPNTSGLTSASSPSREPIEPVDKAEQKPSAVFCEPSATSGKNGATRPHSSAGILNMGSHAHSHHLQCQHNTKEHESCSTGNSDSSYGSSLSHPPLPSTSAHSSSSNPTTLSSLSSHHQPLRTQSQSQIPNSLRVLEHTKSMPESHKSKRKDHLRPLPPIPPSPLANSHDTAPVINGNVREPAPGSPTRSTATTMSTSSHAKESSSNHAFGPGFGLGETKDGFSAAAKQIRRAGRKLSLTAPFLHFGRKDKDKHREKEVSSQVPSVTKH